ncbi:MAG: Lrp/AsnC family transcriptional regulator [Clostridiales bacterium]|jgi:DNA-binding Lrp family transcriptional regulator|nr:Lrp/AsnC family transcriptional regulator [Clostridiales bacterium]OPZ69435.1 MAG: Leucine-responsive regulatory protein [Firmicutes bacterium ADurb.Bin467]
MQKMEMHILEILTDDARTSVGQIAAMLGLSEDAVQAAIAGLEEQRIILKYPALINWEKVDVEEVEALIEVRVTPERDHGFDAIAEQIYRFEEVRNVYLMSGGYDLLVMLKSSSLKKLALFVAQKLSTIDGVLSTATHFVLKRYKSEGVILDEKTEDRRLKVSP